ncbi:kinase-like domain-containing protein, partial [Mycena belliarum]
LNRLIVKLSISCGKYPSSLSLQGVEQMDEHPFDSGGFADIHKAVYQSKPVALKQIRFYQDRTDEQRRKIQEKFCQEALLWKNLDHPFVLPFLGLVPRGGDPQDGTGPTYQLLPSMVCPWMSNGTIMKYLKKFPRTPIDIMVGSCLLEIAQGLQYLHSQCIVHGDIRGTNILVDDDGHPRLADFGLSTYADATVKSSTRTGSTRWMAPELLSPGTEGFRRTFASDVYAFACVCYELYNGGHPFQDIRDDAAALLAVIDGKRPGRLASIPPQTWELIQACWCHEPIKRLTLPSIVEKLE